MAKHRILLISTICLLFVSLLGNAFLLHRVRVEQEKVKLPVIPTLTEDYFQQRLTESDYIKQRLSETENDSYEIEALNCEMTGEENFRLYDVERIGQNPDYPNGCEATAAYMLLRYYGFDLSLSEFIDNFLPMEEVYEIDGVRYGPDPSVAYAGDPASETRGWGCFRPVIATALQNVLTTYPEQAISLLRSDDDTFFYRRLVLTEDSYLSLPELVLTHSGPVVLWVTSDYSKAEDVYLWKSTDGQSSYTYPKKSHAVLLVGYDESNYFINDPLHPEQLVSVSKTQLEESFDSLGRQAIGLESDDWLVEAYPYEKP